MSIFFRRIDFVVPLALSLSTGIILYQLGFDLSVTILVSLMIELFLTLALVLRKLIQIEGILGLGEGVSQLADITPKIHEISKTADKWRRTLLQEEVSAFRLRISYLDRQAVPLSPEIFIDFAAAVFESMGVDDELRAISLFGGGEYWSHRYGEQYAKLNEGAALNGASISRLFVAKDETDLERLRNVCDDQIGRGIKVATIFYDDLREFYSDSAKDFFVLNDELVAEFIFSADFKSVDKIRIITMKSEVARYSVLIKKAFSVSDQV